MDKLPPEQYYASLPKVPFSSGLLLRDKTGRILVVKPNYKEGWLIPGGVAEKGETPTACAIREVREELGLETEPGQLLVVNVVIRPSGLGSIHFIFDGGELDESKISSIMPQKEELDRFKFIWSGELEDHFQGYKLERIRAALEAVKDGRIRHLETKTDMMW
jgi:8-oxo-dGTP pyrophosphatase MutT (NUDIX family)